MAYLLLVPQDSQDDARHITCISCSRPHEVNMMYVLDNHNASILRRKLLDIIVPKIEAIMDYWEVAPGAHSSQNSVDTYRLKFQACITICLLLPHLSSSAENSQYTTLEHYARDLTDTLTGNIESEIDSDIPGSQSAYQIALETIQPYLPPVQWTDMRNARQHVDMRNLIVNTAKALRNRTCSQISERRDHHDTIEDDGFGTHRSQTATDVSQHSMPRQQQALACSTVAYYTSITAHTIYTMMIIDEVNELNNIPASFVDYLLALSSEQLLTMQPFLNQIFNSDMLFVADGSTRLIEHIGNLISMAEYERCEVALCLCLETLSGLDYAWSNVADGSAADSALQLYHWMIDVAMKKTLLSPTTEVAVAEMLFRLIRAQPDYGTSLGIATPRTQLLSMLSDRSSLVQFYIGERIDEIFDLFTLKNHDSLFVDVLKQLPADPEEAEGIAFRIYTLSRLASRWHTLLRRSVYHIYEVPATMGRFQHHAQKCMGTIAMRLNLESPKKLFMLFAPQFLYTWLENNSLESIPFAIFGFTTLPKLLSDIKEEATSLLLMRGHTQSLETLAQMLDTTKTDLVRISFSKAMSYAIGWDKSRRLSEGNTTSAESRIWKLLGKESFYECLNLHFVDIISTMFCLIDMDEEPEIRFARDASTKHAADILIRIKRISSSRTTLSAPQQPTFRLKFFKYMVAHLCSRVEHKPEKLYTKTLVVFIARKFLRTAHTALGSLHACAVIRKLRMLVSLSGDVALSGYPLEMLLHSIRPFIQESECTDDAIGLVQYLIQEGATYLHKHPSFFAGITMSLMGALRSFMSSSQSSTTQESQFRSTKDAAQRFHQWLGNHASKYKPYGAPSDLNARLHDLLKSAHAIGPMGKAEVHSPEGELLRLLLEDDQIEHSVLDVQSRKLALGMLCSKFESPASFRVDILGSDEAAKSFMDVVWTSASLFDLNQAYLTWSAKVVGRAYAASGHISPAMLRETRLKLSSPLLTANADDNSRGAIVGILQDYILFDDRTTNDVAETAIRSILANADQELVHICEQILKVQLMEASTWAPFLPPLIDNGDMVDASPLAEATWSQDAISQDGWLRDFSMDLIRAVPEDPILKAIGPVLQHINRITDHVFPYMLHIVLLADLRAQRKLMKRLSVAFNAWFQSPQSQKEHSKALISAILYLRTQPYPNETSVADRAGWLELDYLKASFAAQRCGMYKTALLFIEQHASSLGQRQSNRRSSNFRDNGCPELPVDALLTIFENIDDPDMYYGVQQNSSLDTILARLEYENDGQRSLLFRGAKYDSHLRRNDSAAVIDAHALVDALAAMNLNGVSRSISQDLQNTKANISINDSMYLNARKLEQWDLPVPGDTCSNLANLYGTFQAIHTALDRQKVSRIVDKSLARAMHHLVQGDLGLKGLHESLRTISALAELDDILEATGSEQFEAITKVLHDRSSWMSTGRCVVSF